MEKSTYVECLVAAVIRYWLFRSDRNSDLAARVEVSTPANSWKRVVEGVTLYNESTNPYLGDMFHETPFVLWIFSWLMKNVSLDNIDIVFIACDIFTSLILYKAASKYVWELFQKQEREKNDYVNDVTDVLIQEEDLMLVPIYVLSAYLFNPYCIINCVAKTTTVLSNLLLSLLFYFMLSNNIICSSMTLTLCILQTLYPVNLFSPLCLRLYSIGKRHLIFFLLFFAIFFSLSLYISYNITGDWSFVDSTFTFILNVPDLKPNVGLFWYFFTEMFEHFRPLFLWSFQINALLLYLIPLSITLRKDPVLLIMTLIALNAIFKSYPSIGDVGFYLALLPMWKHLFPFMQQGFIVTSFFVGCSAFAPTVWHLWIYSGSANANFFFGVTLAFATTQIFLVTDILFAYMKREFMLKNSITSSTGSKCEKLVLE